jgi:hypothetical protein
VVTTTTTTTTTTITITTTTMDIRRFIGYWTIDGENGNIASFRSVQTTRTIGTN